MWPVTSASRSAATTAIFAGGGGVSGRQKHALSGTSLVLRQHFGAIFIHKRFRFHVAVRSDGKRHKVLIIDRV